MYKFYRKTRYVTKFCIVGVECASLLNECTVMGVLIVKFEFNDKPFYMMKNNS